MDDLDTRFKAYANAVKQPPSSGGDLESRFADYAKKQSTPRAPYQTGAAARQAATSKPQPSTTQSVGQFLTTPIDQQPTLGRKLAKGGIEVAGMLAGLPSEEVSKGASKGLIGSAYNLLGNSSPTGKVVEFAAEKLGYPEAGKAANAALSGSIGKYALDKLGVSDKVEKATTARNTEQKIGKVGEGIAEALVPIPGAVSQAKILRSGKAAEDAVSLLEKGIRPRSSSLNFKNNLKTAIPDIKLTEALNGKPIETARDLMDAIKQTKKSLWDSVDKLLSEASNKTQVGWEKGKGLVATRGTKADLTPVGKAAIDAISPEERLLDPEKYKKTVAEIQKKFFGKQIDVRDIENLLEQVNGKLQAYYAQFPTVKTAELKKHSAIASIVKEAEAYRDILNKSLDKLGNGYAAKVLKNRFGAQRALEEELQRRIVVAERQAPDSAFGRFGKLFGLRDIAIGVGETATEVGRAGPLRAIIGLGERSYAKHLAESQTTDALIKKALADFKGPPPVPIRRPASPVEELKTAGSYARRLEGGKSPVGVSGTIVPDITGQIQQGAKKLNTTRQLPPAQFEGRITQPPVRRGGYSRQIEGTVRPKTPDGREILPDGTVVPPPRRLPGEPGPSAGTGTPGRKPTTAPPRPATSREVRAAGTPGEESAIGPAGTVPSQSKETPRQLPGVKSGRMQDILRDKAAEEAEKLVPKKTPPPLQSNAKNATLTQVKNPETGKMEWVAEVSVQGSIPPPEGAVKIRVKDPKTGKIVEKYRYRTKTPPGGPNANK